MDTTNHNIRQYSAVQNANIMHCFAPENKVRGVYFGADSIPLTILQINRQNGNIHSLEKGNSSPILRQREGFCKEKEKLFARLRGSPPQRNNRIAQILRENPSDFAGFAVLVVAQTDGRCVW